MGGRRCVTPPLHPPPRWQVRLCQTHLYNTLYPPQIVSSAKDVVITARHAVTGRVFGAKDTVSDTLSTVVDRTRGAVQGGMERTRAVVSSSVSAVLESRVAQLVSSSVDSALSTSESLVEQYLPQAEDDLGEWPPPSGQEKGVQPPGLETEFVFIVCDVPVITGHVCFHFLFNLQSFSDPNHFVSY